MWRRSGAALCRRPPPTEAVWTVDGDCGALVRGTSGVREPPRVSATGGRGPTGVGTLIVGGGALEVGNVGTVGGSGTVSVGTGTLTVGTGTLTVGTGTLRVGRLGSALAGAITWPEPYPAPNTHPPISNVLMLAPAPLAMIGH